MALAVTLDTPLPERLAVGAGTALFVAGWCVAAEGRIASLAFVVDGAEQPVAAHGMPRIDVFRALHPGVDPYDPPARDPASAQDPGVHAYACGFWGTVVLRSAPFALSLRARLEDGSVVDAELGAVEAETLPGAAATGASVAVCMATCNPDAELFARQVESIRAQTHADWTCVISDDCSDPRRFAAIEAVVGGDERFVVSRSPRRLGFYRNFERALALAPPDAAFVALADQDDDWHPDKLATLLAGIGDARLAYSDARLVEPGGRVLADSYWSERENNHTDLRALLVANSVTGAASLLRRDLLDVALPFPPAQFAHFHDHWLGVCALALGDVAYVDRPLYDYVQHGGAVLGHAAANRVVGVRERLGSLRADPRERIRVYRGIYFVDVARLTQMATVALLRAGGEMPAGKRRVLEDFVAADASLARVARLWLGGAREYLGRPRTLGAERGLAYAFAWRRVLGWTAGERPRRRLRLDAVPPPNLAPRPGQQAVSDPVRDVREKIAPLALAVRDDAPARVNVLIPTIDLDHLFGGYIGKFNLARRLADRGHRVRIVTVDPVGPLPADWRARVEAYEGLSGLFDRVEVAFGREALGGLEVGRDDRFVATTWWTAHVADAARAALDGPPFVYLVQEYEPFTFPMSTWGALAEQSYRFAHRALFSTALLEEWFGLRGVGAALETASFENAITRVAPPALTASGRRLLFYARPEPHAARNLFELGLLALGEAARAGVLDGWTLHGIGTTALGRRVAVADRAQLDLLPRAAQGTYAQTLAGHDVGLALMHTPHPSLVPLEMASAGMLAVTSTFENKTAERLRALSSNLIGAEPTVDAVAAALAEAVAGADDLERRRAGADVRWARDWESAFSDDLLDRVGGWLA